MADPKPRPEDYVSGGETSPGSSAPPLEDTESIEYAPGAVEAAISLENYRIIRKIGEGGMGMVYEAEQHSPRRLVALKIIRGGPLASARAQRLFQREIRALALLRHPGIAAIYESGRTAQGQNFYSMELAGGQTLDAYLRLQDEQPREGRDLLRARLELFLRIAGAVNYAHQRGVIHRDLKPSNVLVDDKDTASVTYTGFEDYLEVKVLDFGLARITDPGSEGHSMTEAGRLEGTLSYMSPEQVRGNPDEIDLRTDIYSMGVMLYLMISGHLPYKVQKLPLPEAARVICDEAPQPISTALTRSGKVDADLNTIVMTALEKEPARRYQSMAAMAEDIRRYLANEPIVARAPSTWYHVKKMVVRHRVAAGFSLALLAVLVGSSITMLIQARRIQREAESTRRVSQFMVDLFKGSDPGEARGRTLTVREVLENGSRRVATELKDEPAAQSQLQLTAGTVFRSLSSYQQARPLLEASLETRKRLYGEGSLEAAEVYEELGDTLRVMGKYPEARAAAERAVAIRKSRLGEQNALTAESMNKLALILENSNQVDAAEKLFGESLGILDRVKGPASLEISAVLNNFAVLKWRQGDFAAAERLARRALEIRRKAYPDGHPSVANSLQLLGTILIQTGNYQQSEQSTREALAMRERLFGPGSEDAVQSTGELAAVLVAQGRYAEAAPLYQQNLDTDRKFLGDNHPTVAIDLSALALCLQRLRRLDDAEPLYRRSLAIRNTVFGKDSPQSAVVLYNLASLLDSKGDLKEAERLYEQSIDIKVRTQGESHPNTADAKIALALLYIKHGKLKEADGLLRTGVEDRLKATPASPEAGRLLTLRADYYATTDRPNEADGDYRKAIEILSSALPADHPLLVGAGQKYAHFRASQRH
jgi:serine/threonine protein kinase/Flp pilus assembly protein TadD